MIGFFASKCTGLTPSSTPPCGGAFTTAVGAALAIALDMWGEYRGFPRSYFSTLRFAKASPEKLGSDRDNNALVRWEAGCR
jgi:hypothetical protein